MGLPEQTKIDALRDLAQAIALNPTHISWYELTIEPHTAFFRRPPSNRPSHDTCFSIQQAGIQQLLDAGFMQYEVSAFAKQHHQCQHNLHYWRFDDYLGIGAGAHSKLTLTDGRAIRQWRYRPPHHYLDPKRRFIAGESEITSTTIILEYLMNHLRLIQEPIIFKHFEAYTKQARSTLTTWLEKSEQQSFLKVNQDNFQLTEKGHAFIDTLLLDWN